MGSNTSISLVLLESNLTRFTCTWLHFILYQVFLCLSSLLSLLGSFPTRFHIGLHPLVQIVTSSEHLKVFRPTRPIHLEGACFVSSSTRAPLAVHQADPFRNHVFSSYSRIWQNPFQILGRICWYLTNNYSMICPVKYYWAYYYVLKFEWHRKKK